MTHRTIFLTVAALVFGTAAWAHHSMSALFDINDKVTITGTLSKIDWRNPHIELSWIQMVAAPKPGRSKVHRQVSSARATSRGATSKRRSIRR